jgi:hypothetical protein
MNLGIARNRDVVRLSFLKACSRSKQRQPCPVLDSIQPLFFKFRDWTGKYPIHCHNVVHEDHAMMALWHVLPQGDMVLTP